MVKFNHETLKGLGPIDALLPSLSKTVLMLDKAEGVRCSHSTLATDNAVEH